MGTVGELLRIELTRQAEHAILWLVVAFGAGIVLFFTWTSDPTLWITAAPLVGAIALLRLRARVFGAGFAAVVLLSFGLGHGAAVWRTARVATPLLERETRPFMLSAVVVDAEKRPDGNRLVVAGFRIPDLAPEATPHRLRITIPVSHGLPAVGERIAVRVVARPAAPPILPDGFQFQRFLYFEGIGGVGYAVGRWQSESDSARLTLAGLFHAAAAALRRKIGERITAVVPGRDGTVVGALVNGEQSAIPEDLQEAYRIAGIAHLLSISGVHMSLLAAVVFFMVRRLLALISAIALRIDTKKVAAVVGLVAAAFYLVISGMSVPAVRSFLMIAVVMAAVLLDRTALSLRTISWAALVLMAIFPDAVIGASFQMSFLAVLSLIALYEQAWLRIAWRDSEGRLMLVRAIAAYFAGLVVTDVVAGGTTALFAAYHFNRLPTYSAVTNLAAVPLTGLWIMPAGILGLLLMPFGWDEIPFRVMGVGVAVLDDLARTIAGWPGAQVHVPPMAAWALALGALGLVFTCVWRGRGRWLGLLAVLPAALQPVLAAPPDALVDDTARVFAVSDASGRLVVKPGRTARFVREAWIERFGASLNSWPAPGKADAALGLACDADGCILARNGQRLLLAFTPTALAEDCGEADVTVSATASRDICRQGKVVDLIDLRREGAVAVRLTHDGVQKRTVRDGTGNRVWMRGVNNEADDPPDELAP